MVTFTEGIFNGKHHFLCSVIIIGRQLLSSGSKKYWLLVMKLSELLIDSYRRWSAIISVKLFQIETCTAKSSTVYTSFSVFSDNFKSFSLIRLSFDLCRF